MEVPTVLCYSSLQRLVEQNVDIPGRRVQGDRDVVKVLPQDQVQRSELWSRSVTILLVEVFKVFPQKRIRCSALWRRTLTFLLVEVFTDFSLILALQARVKSVGVGFFSHFSFG